MRRAEALRTSRYFLAGLAWAGALGGGLVYALASASQRLLWTLTMKRHTLPPWLWVEVLLICVALGVYGYRLVLAALHYRQKQRLLNITVSPLLQPFSAALPPSLQRIADWYFIDSDEEPYAFTWGIARPRIVISRRLWLALDDKAQKAVLYHEAAHALARDPLQQAILHILAKALGPAGLGLLYRQYLIQREIAADQWAIRACNGDDAPLLQALWTASQSLPDLSPRVGLVGVLEARLHFLETRESPSNWDPRLRYHMLSSSLAVLVTLCEGVFLRCH